MKTMTPTRRTLCLTLFALASALAAGPAWAHEPLAFSPTLISDVAEAVTPAVVNITTRRDRSAPQLEGPPMFRELFGHERTPQPELGAGSGVIVSADGDVVTNNHVIETADEIVVTLSDRREFKARLVGTDKPSDLAFLKIDAKDLPFVKFGDSATLRLGELVLAIGNPFGVGQTVTMGIVSAKGRANVGIVDYEDFIQTDASINPGNSGGALVNLRGELVGINTAILSRSGGAQGIGFAVPSNMVRPIRDQVASQGRVRRGRLGVAIQDLTPDLARSMELKDAAGVLVSDVQNGSPADTAKVESGDVIVKVNEFSTPTAAQLRNRIALTTPGTRVKISLLRSGKPREVFVTLDELVPDTVVAATVGKPDRLLSGLTVSALDGGARAQLRLPSHVRGVVVSRVEAGSPAERSGLEESDVIVAVNRRQLSSPSELASLVPKDAREVLLRVFQRGVFKYVVLRR